MGYDFYNNHFICTKYMNDPVSHCIAPLIPLIRHVYNYGTNMHLG